MSLEKDLCDEYEKFCRINNLPKMCAHELVEEADERNLSSRQLAWLKDFIRRWEEVES